MHMMLIQIIALLIFIVILGCAFHKGFTEMIPVAVSILVLFLYALSFGNLLWLVDWIAPVFLLGAFVVWATRGADRRKELLGNVCRELCAPSFLAAIALMGIVTIAVSFKITTWWDDYNFWATDVKSLFYLNGFAAKYENVAAEFGDYPPGTQMMKWWFLHFSPAEFKEGLMFAGYYVFNLAYFVPLLERIKKKNVFTMVAGMVLLWLFPSMVEAFWCDGSCADFSMAVIYGAFLTAVLDHKQESALFYYGRQALYLMVLVLCKNTGFIWVAFGLLFTLCYSRIVLRKEETYSARIRRRGLWSVMILPVLTEGSWLLFCIKNRRVAKLTGAAVQMVTGSMNIPDYQEQLGKAFVEAFLKWPLHKTTNGLINFSPLALLIFVLVMFVVLGVRKKVSIREVRFLFLYTLITALFFYSLNLVSHLTIFAVEPQYLEPSGMIWSMERYGAPFTIGTLYLLGYLCLEKEREYVGLLCCAIVILLSTDYTAAYRAIWGYRSTVQEELDRRAEIVDTQAEDFLQKIGAGTSESIGRVLYLRDATDVSWVRNTYINFEAAPVSVMYGNVDGEATGYEELIQMIEDSHAQFLYVEPLEKDGEALFEELTDGERFQYDTLYRIVEQENKMQLMLYGEQ